MPRWPRGREKLLARAAKHVNPFRTVGMQAAVGGARLQCNEVPAAACSQKNSTKRISDNLLRGVGFARALIQLQMLGKTYSRVRGIFCRLAQPTVPTPRWGTLASSGRLL